MKKGTLVGIILVLSAASMGSGVLSCSPGGYSAEVETITIAVPPLEQNALLYVAESKKLFSRNGLNIVIEDFDSGVTSINAMLNGEADIAEAAEFPFVRAAFQKEQISIIASNDKFENNYIVGRKDRGIENISDLRGKRIGVALKTMNEFYLGRFLSLNGLKMQDVTPVDVSPTQFVSAIAGGEVDAIIAWQPHISRVRKELNEAVIWPAQSSQAVYGILITRNEWLIQHDGTVERFLRSLKEGEDYLVRHPDEARAIVQKRLSYDDEYIASVWSQHQFALSLDLSLITAMNDEAVWMIGNDLTTEKTVPDFKDYIYIDGLKAVRPSAVNIIR